MIVAGEKLGPGKLITHVFDGLNMATLRKVSDVIRQQVPSGVCVLGGKCGTEASILVTVSDDVVKQGIRADVIVKDVAPIIGGSGGGKPQMAQAGGKNSQKITDAVEKAKQFIKQTVIK